VTLSAADALGVADRTGSLTAGKLANVVAWSGSPLTKEAAPKWVFVDGVLYEPEPKDEKGKKDEKKDAAPKPEEAR
jgi:imidazolonepropionase-like amidohydrolase